MCLFGVINLNLILNPYLSPVRRDNAHQWKLGVRWQMIFAVYDESCYYSNAVHTCTCGVNARDPYPPNAGPKLRVNYNYKTTTL